MAAVALGATLAAALVVVAAVFAAPASAGPYVNPTTAEIRAKLSSAAVARDIPPKILYGIAFQESTWRQFTAAGDPLISGDNGIGIMQVTTIPAGVDVERLKTDIDYNIAVGADILLVKWNYAPSVIPVIGDGDKHWYENWFYAVWAYNGWVAYNEYPYKVWGHIASGPEGWWTGVPVTPVPKTWLRNGFGVTVPTPEPANYWSPAPRPKPALSAPRAPARVVADRRFYVVGELSPRHPAGAHSVFIRCYRFNGRSWVLKRTVAATNRDSAGATRYVARFALGKTGRWRLRAYAPADADHAAVTSALRTMRVR